MNSEPPPKAVFLGLGEELPKIKISQSSSTMPLDLSDVELHVYKQRWIVLATVALLNCSNTLLWISLSPVSNFAESFYSFGAKWFSLVFIVTTIPVAFGAMYAGSRFGIRSSIMIAAWTNGIGAAIRLSSSWLPQEGRFPVGIVGQAIASVAYPFIMFLPTTVAGAWFSDTQRALATTIGIMSNPLGVLLANFIAPHIVNDSHPDNIPLLNILVAAPAIFAVVLATFGVTRSLPKLPPTLSASQPATAFFPGLKKLFTSKTYLLLLVVMGGGIGMFNTLYTIMQSLLCPTGYSNVFSGLVAGLMILGGVLGSAMSSIFVDRTKKYELTIKACLTVAVLIFVGFLQMALHPNLSIFIAIAAALLGLTGLATYPVGLEMSAECSYPVTQALSTGMIVLSGQIQSAIYIVMVTMLERPFTGDKDVQTCSIASDPKNSVDPWDMTLSTYPFSIIAILLAASLVLFFKPKMRRMHMDQSVATFRSQVSEDPAVKY